jgi:acyl-coenzyme A thioesterase PaaI-like protein
LDDRNTLGLFQTLAPGQAKFGRRALAWLACDAPPTLRRMTHSLFLHSEVTVPEHGWTPVEPLRALGPIRSFVSADPASERIRISYFRRESDGVLVAKVWFGPDAEGPPGHAHGGAIASVLDEAMGAAAWATGHCAVASRLAVRFRALVPLRVVVMAEARVRGTHVGRLHLNAKICGGGGTPFAEASGLFVQIAPERIGLSRAQ